MATPIRIPFVNLAAQNLALKPDLVAAFERVLGHGQFILGPEVARFEAELAQWLGVPELVSVSNGTDALVLALKLRGVGPGDEVVTTAHSFVATASAVRLVGAVPVFADVDERTMLLDPHRAEEAITPLTRAVMPVHLNGCPDDLAAFAELCARRKVALIEDCAQAIGARFDGRSVGTFGLGCFSLHPLKILAALGDAGFVVPRDAAEAARLRRMRNIGLVDRDHCESVDGNCRLDALQAALLLAKLPYVPRWIAARRAHAAAYRDALVGLVELPPDDPRARQVYSGFVIRLDGRDRLAAHLAERGIDTKVHYPIPLHRQQAFADLPVRASLPATERTCERILSLPVSPELSEGEREEVIAEIRAFFGCRKARAP